MGRHSKTGIDYFPLDCDYFSDPKIYALRSQCGNIGELIFIRLLTQIFDNGYFLEWSELEQFSLSGQLGVESDVVDRVIEACLQFKIFDRTMFESYKILTSEAIQQRFKKATERRASNGIDDIYSLVAHSGTVERDLCIHKSDSTGGDVCKSTQSKVKQSKVDKSKVKESVCTHTLLSKVFKFSDPEIEESKSGKLFKTLFQLEAFDCDHVQHKKFARMPMKKYPDVWATFEEFADLILEFKKRGVPEREFSRPFRKVQIRFDEWKLDPDKENNIPKTSSIGWLQKWALSETIDDLKKEGIYKN